MKRIVFFVLLIVFVGVGLLKSEVVYLKDGSTLKGTVKKMSGDTLYFEASFGSLMKISKDKIVRIDFAEGSSVVSPGPPPAVEESGASAEPGSLMVVFEKVKFTSKISVKRDRDREGHERENAIEMRLMLEGNTIYSLIDSTTDKVIANGPETTLRNDIEPQAFSLALAPGMYQGALRIGNTRIDKYAERFDPEPLDKLLVLDNLKIKPNETLVVRVTVKKKLLGLKKSDMSRQQ